MSIRVTGRKLKGALALGALIAAATLSGCTTPGGGMFGASAPATTGSIGGQPTSFNQPMPSALGGAPQSDGRYLPPASIGGGTMVANTQPLTPMGGSSVITQDLPDLPQTSTLGSSQQMPAQPMAQLAPAPQSSIVDSSQPQLQVVADNTQYRHTIASGESLYSIARQYNVTTQAIIHANGFTSPDRIFVGQQIVIPGRQDLLNRPATQAPVQMAAIQDDVTTGAINTAPLPAPSHSQAITQPELVAETDTLPTSQTPAISAVQTAATPPATAATSFRWPVSGRVITNFEASRGTGINIEAAEGTSVRAAEGGSVIYVGSDVEGYGNLILIRHENGYVSAYAHLAGSSVARGDVVRKGDTIGTVGMTGSVSRPQLHFELRMGATPVDPTPLLAS